MTEQFPTEPTNPYPAQSPQTGQEHGYPPQGGYGVQPQPISPAQERTLGAVAHGAPLVAMVLSAGLLGFVGSLIIYVMYKDRGPFVRQHAANSLNVQIMLLLVFLVSVPLILALGLGLLIMMVAPFVAGALHILGAIKANNGEWWEPPMTPKFVR